MDQQVYDYLRLAPLCLILCISPLIAQEQLKVEGDVRIEGILTLIEGNENTVVGNGAGSALTTGDNNIFIGNTAGKHNTTGANNIFIGRAAGLLMKPARIMPVLAK